MSHSIENLLIVCMDFRLPKIHVDWAEKILGNKNYDLVALAGSQKAILDEDTRAAVFKQIETSVNLHGIKTINIIAHEDCGAYGGSKAFSSWGEERQKYVEDLAKAEKLVKEKFEVEVKKYILLLNGKVELV
ncbi:MAG: hypothetical protein PHD51_01600 [Patescibacteria group bacterium]|nr:hypothetical protein [Patescibacteria group bacterium]MDD5490443.1 hypothetical protein [Patescibacteria group bacterium]